jgi:comEA protein
MTQDSRATRRRLSPVIILCALVMVSACVKLPRKHTQTTAGEGRDRLVAAGQEGVAAQLVDINTASPVELEKLPGIGRGLAARIIAHREQYGRFRRVEHLLMVRGIGERRFRKMRAVIRAG